MPIAFSSADAVPAGAEVLGVPLFEGRLVPRGTPKEVIDLLYREVAKIVVLPDVNEKLATFGFEPVANTPEEFGARIELEIVKWGKVVREAGIKIE